MLAAAKIRVAILRGIIREEKCPILVQLGQPCISAYLRLLATKDSPEENWRITQSGGIWSEPSWANVNIG